MNVLISLSATDYVQTLQKQFIPPGIVATRADAKSEWNRDAKRDLLHSHWLIEHHRSLRKLVGNGGYVNFDTVVAYGGVRLSALLPDRLAKKLFCLSLLKKNVAPNGILKACEYFDWYTRYRISRGMENNRDHTEETLRLYRKDITKGDLIGLLPYENWLDHLIEKVENGSISLVTTRQTFDWGKVSDQFGVSRAVLTRSKDFRFHLAERIQLLSQGALNSSAVISTMEQSEAGISTTTALHLLNPLEWAYVGGQTGEAWFNPILLHPFKQMTKSACATDISRTPRRTATLRPEDFIRLLDLAAKWVLDYSEYILTAFRMLSTENGLRTAKTRRPLKCALEEKLDAMRPEGAPQISLSWRDTTPLEGRITTSLAVKHLVSACIILIGGFAARRLGEITNLVAGCLTGSGNCLFLSIYIEKTLRHYDDVPVPALLKRPVAIMEELSENARHKSGEPWLFEIVAPAGAEKEKLCTRYGLRLDDFVTFNALAPPIGHKTWEFSSHQLRRGFGIIYVNGFMLSSFDALSRFYRHNDPEMTRIYINHVLPGLMSELREELRARQQSFRLSDEDKAFIAQAKQQLLELEDRAEAFRDHRSNAIASRLIAIWDGAERPFGKGGQSLSALVDRLKDSVQVQIRHGQRSNSPEEARKAFAQVAKDTAYGLFMEAVPGVGVHCLCDPNDADQVAVAQCELLRLTHEDNVVLPQVHVPVARDFAFTNTYVCLSCAHASCFREDEKILDTKQSKLEKAVEGAFSSASKELASEKLAEFKSRLAAARGVA
ncbi:MULTISPECIES: site-specific integrase [unclassified Rhizobium]|uniref:site-specific integrase n=1 Tax=unclassified Rhizobium TaxID=2613769 RepID=UPI001AE7D9CE|nr:MULTISPECIES: site-specific integrase [unclassified Rhizobium]MBP2460514.1 hypothetical protein [Rhizobium sp. PvP014]MBP2527911.1 hypothetical protein [Rhizobium sp. PvP099]